MKRYWLNFKERKIGRYKYRILRIYKPSTDVHEYQLQRKEIGLFAGSWEYVTQTIQYTEAKKWEDEMGLLINDKPDRIRKPLL